MRFVLVFLYNFFNRFIGLFLSRSSGLFGGIISFAIQTFLWKKAPEYEDALKHKVRQWKRLEHESGLPMAEWEDRQRQKELDEKLTAGTYTDAEKEYLIYTAQLETEKKDELRKKHLPKNKRKPGI